MTKDEIRILEEKIINVCKNIFDPEIPVSIYELGLIYETKVSVDGKVEVLAEGKERGLKEFIKWCYNGSKGAKVDEVEVEWRDYENKFDNFKILL